MENSLKQYLTSTINSFISGVNNGYMLIVNNITEAAYANDFQRAKNYLSDGVATSQPIVNLIDELQNLATTTLYSISDKTTVSANNSIAIMLIVSILSIIFALIIAMAIATAIKNSVIKVTNASTEIAIGNFNVEVGSNDKDELGLLSNALLDLKLSISHVTGDIIQLSSIMSKGAYKSRIDETKHRGEFRNLVTAINESINDLISDTVYSIEKMTEFSSGNFDADVKVFPGDKVILTNSTITVQKNLKMVNQEISKIIEGAIDGNIDLTINTNAYEGDWKKK